MSKFSISPANRYFIDLMVERMIEANNNNAQKDYDCYSEALKAFLVNLLGSELYLAIERRIDWFDGKHASQLLEGWIEEHHDDMRRQKENDQEQHMIDILSNGHFHTLRDISTLCEIDLVTVERIFNDNILHTFEVVCRRFDDKGIAWKIAY